MAVGALSSCTNHPGVEAAGRCKQCGKPFCSACEVAGPTGRFCSQACKDRHESFTQRAAQLDDMRRDTSFFAKLWIRVKKLLVWVIAALAIAVALHFFGVHVPFVSPFIQRMF